MTNRQFGIAICVLVVIFLALIVWAGHLISPVVKAEKNCMEHGFFEARVYGNGDVFCIGMKDGNTVVVPLKSLCGKE